MDSLLCEIYLLLGLDGSMLVGLRELFTVLLDFTDPFLPELIKFLLRLEEGGLLELNCLWVLDLERELVGDELVSLTVLCFSSSSSY